MTVGFFSSMLRSWRRRPVTTVSTAFVLAASFSLIAFILITAVNMKHVLATWGEKVSLSVYLNDEISVHAMQALESKIAAMPDVKGFENVSKKQAAEMFREQMAGYAPELLEDSEFSTPFPASIKVLVADGLAAEGSLERLESMAKTIMEFDGVEDVSYGQSWVKGYASVFQAVTVVGGFIGAIILLGALFIIANSVRASINEKRDEIEIYELVGASREFIRRPYLLEGASIGFAAGLSALILNFAFSVWMRHLMKTSFAFARMAAEYRFFSPPESIAFIAAAALIGLFSAHVTVSSINDGWAAARRARGIA